MNRFVPISSKFHAVLDYVTGALLVIYPLERGWDFDSPPAQVMIAAGVATLVYSLLTDYDLGLAPYIPFKVHLGLDLLQGLFLIAAPWLLGFWEETYGMHLVIGLVELGVVAFTRAEVAPDE